MPNRTQSKPPDFRINCPEGSTYCSILDTEDCPVGHTLQLRYVKNTMVGVITKQADGTYSGTFDDDIPLDRNTVGRLARSK
jgi:hypothetical protein